MKIQRLAVVEKGTHYNVKVLEQSDERLVIRCGSPWYALWGFPFLAFGVGYLIPALINSATTNYLLAGSVTSISAGLLTAFLCAHHSLLVLDRSKKKVHVQRRWYPFAVSDVEYRIQDLAGSELDVDAWISDGYGDRVTLISKSGEQIPLTATTSGFWNSQGVCDAINDFFNKS